MTSSEVVIVGAGNIGRGLLGELLAGAGLRSVFVEVRPELVRALQTAGSYRVHLVGRCETWREVRSYGVLSTQEGPTLAEALAGCAFAATAVGGQNLPAVASLLAAGLRQRTTPLKILVCENWPQADRVLAQALAAQGVASERYGCVACSVERMVRPLSGTLDLLGECGESVLLARSQWLGTTSPRGAFPARDGAPLPAVPGFVLCDDLAPYYARKLFTNNAGHAVLAYLGYLAGCALIPEALRQPEVRITLEGLLPLAAEALAREYALDRTQLTGHIHTLLAYRFANVQLADPIQRVARQPLRKLAPGERLVGLLRLLQRHSLPTAAVCRTIGAALHYWDAQDAECLRLRALLAEEGAPAVLRQVCQLQPDDPSWGLCLDHFTRYAQTRPETFDTAPIP